MTNSSRVSTRSAPTILEVTSLVDQLKVCFETSLSELPLLVFRAARPNRSSEDAPLRPQRPPLTPRPPMALLVRHCRERAKIILSFLFALGGELQLYLRSQGRKECHCLLTCDAGESLVCDCEDDRL